MEAKIPLSKLVILEKISFKSFLYYLKMTKVAFTSYLKVLT